PRRTLRSLRRSLEQESLMAYAATAAGVRTPRLVATSEVGTEAALLAYEHVPGPTLNELADEEITEELLADIWEQLRLLQANGRAHGSLVGESMGVAEPGGPDGPAVHAVAAGTADSPEAADSPEPAGYPAGDPGGDPAGGGSAGAGRAAFLTDLRAGE